MDALQFRNLFFFLFILKIIVKLGLDLLNLSHLQKNYEKIPSNLKAWINPTKISTINRYHRDKIIYNIISYLFTNILLMIFLFTPWYSKYTHVFISLALPYFLKGILFFLLLSWISWIFDLPFHYYFHFRIEAKYGFNQYTGQRWIIDELKNLMVSTLLSILILALIFGCWGDPFHFKWQDIFIGWIVSSLLVILFMYLIPILLIPFFYRLKPIENTILQQKIEELAHKSGFKVRGIFLADASTKSSHANASISGIGHSKTIILFDTLLNNYTETEILAIIAHEIGHGKKGHLVKLTILTIVELFLFILFASYLLSLSFIYHAMVIPKIFFSGAFLVYILFFDLITFYIQPLFSFYSRALEYEADQFSKQLLNDPEPLISSFRKLMANELENIFPHPLFEAFYYSHPTLLKRILALQNHP